MPTQEKRQPQQSQQANPNREIVLQLTPEALAEWKNSPQTKEVLRFLRRIREWHRDQPTLNLNSVETTALLTSYKSGLDYGLMQILELQLPSPEEEEQGTGY